MNEKELLNILSSLKKIEPRKDWVSLTKNYILAQKNAEPYAEPRRNWVGQIGGVGQVFDTLTFLFKKPAFAMAGFGLVIALGVLFQFNQQKLAQDAVAQIALAQERLEQLQKIAAVNGANLAVALKEFQETSAKLSRQVAGLEVKDHAKALQVGIAVIQLQKSAQALEEVFGVAVGEKTSQDLTNAVKTVVENELADLSTRTLSTEQQELFEEAKAAFETGDYETALEKIWAVSN